jgi:Tol biopolymer transport system component
MTLAAGTRLGPYEILSPLGAGGMGEVYRAKDTKLKRDVAVKVLPELLAKDADALARFEREAHAVAALNHPNILSIHDFGHESGFAYAVTELLEGETLRAEVEAGPLPVRRATEIAIQIARGLAAAHEKGIIHRDLKPENVFLTSDGRVKVLDFGLAKRVAREAAETSAPTTPAGTEPGTVMGTMGYMSPEQVRGRNVDDRTDIFSFGAMLYEMLTGKKAFRRETDAETMTAILREDPPGLVATGATIPPVLDRIVRHCLEKKPEQRFQSASDIAFALDGALEIPPSVGTKQAPSPARGRRAAAAITVVASAAVAAAALYFARRPAAAPEWEDASVTALTTDAGYAGEPTLSPDGQTLAYVSDRNGNSEIYLQQISGGPAINLTQNSAEDIQPSFSPDGRQIAFVSNRAGVSDVFFAGPKLPLVGGDIWVMPALGGSARRIVERGNFPSWSPDGSTIVYVHGTFKNCRIAKVPAMGGASRDLPIQEPPKRYFYPTFSPDGRWLLYQNGETIEVVSAVGGKPRELLLGEYPAWGPRGDEIVFTNDAPGKNRTLWKARFDPESGSLSGPARPLTFGRGADLGARVSRDGRTIVYSAVDETLNLEKMPFDAEIGRPTGPSAELTRGPNRIGFFSPSPDGASVVFTASLGGRTHLWRIDPPAMPVQLTLDPRFSENSPSWSPDGREIAFDRTPDARDPEGGLWIMRADGAAPRRIADLEGPFSWMPGGRTLVALKGDGLALVDVASGTARTIAGTKTGTLFTVDGAGKWIAFQTTEKGTVDIAAVPVTGGSPRIVVASPREDYHPFFSPSGRWLYFLPDHKNLYRVPGPEQDWKPVPPERVTDFPPAGLYLEDPKIARDGMTLFYTRGHRTGDIYVLRLAPSTRRSNA